MNAAPLNAATANPAPAVAQHPTPPEPTEPSDDGPLWQVSALATATVPTALETGLPFMIGLRGELDVWRLSALITLDRAGAVPFTLDETQHWTALAGASVVSKKWLRVRLLGGASVQSSSAGTAIAPTLGVNGRLFWNFVGVEAAATLTPFGAFQQLDARAELVLRAGVLELHAGYRARLLPSAGADLFSATPLAGPHAAIGLTF